MAGEGSGQLLILQDLARKIGEAGQQFALHQWNWRNMQAYVSVAFGSASSKLEPTGRLVPGAYSCSCAIKLTRTDIPDSARDSASVRERPARSFVPPAALAALGPRSVHIAHRISR
jgi:hypothetical protein